MGQHFRAFDLVVDSAIPLPGAIPVSAAGGADIAITLEPCAPPATAIYDGAYAFGHNSVLFAPPTVAQYYCENGNHIAIEPDPAAEEGAVAIHLAANALPALLWMRGGLVLHACCAVLNNRAIAMCGLSGSGKSTLLRALLALGASSIADDSLRIQETDAGMVASGLPGLTYDVAGKDRIARLIPLDRTKPAAVLSALIFLERVESDPDVSWQRLRGAEAMEGLLRNLHRIKVPRHLGIMPRILETSARLAAMPVYRWRRPQGAMTLRDREIKLLRAITT